MTERWWPLSFISWWKEKNKMFHVCLAYSIWSGHIRSMNECLDPINLRALSPYIELLSIIICSPRPAHRVRKRHLAIPGGHGHPVILLGSENWGVCGECCSHMIREYFVSLFLWTPKAKFVFWIPLLQNILSRCYFALSLMAPFWGQATHSSLPLLRDLFIVRSKLSWDGSSYYCPPVVSMLNWPDTFSLLGRYTRGPLQIPWAGELPVLSNAESKGWKRPQSHLVPPACLGKLSFREGYSLIWNRTQAFCNPFFFLLVWALCWLHSCSSPL